jgi:heme A synthase
MLELQIKLLTAWWLVADSATSRIDDERDRGEVTATTAIIVLLVIAAIAAGTIIATRITTNANNVPTP